MSSVLKCLAGLKCAWGGKLTAADHKGIPLLAALDEQLVAALRSGAIKLLRAEFLRADGSESMLPKLLRRQELERMELERGICVFLTPNEAIAALRSQSRQVAGLTYGWASPDHPDATGEYSSICPTCGASCATRSEST